MSLIPISEDQSYLKNWDYPKNNERIQSNYSCLAIVVHAIDKIEFSKAES